MKTTKALQYFTPEYIGQCREMSAEQIVEFVESFRELHASRNQNTRTRSKLISIKIPQDLLAIFRARCVLERVAYQTQIKELMRDWLTRQ